MSVVIGATIAILLAALAGRRGAREGRVLVPVRIGKRGEGRSGYREGDDA